MGPNTDIPSYGHPTQPTKKRRKRRVFLWIFLAVQAIFLIWIITGAVSASHGTCTNLTANECTSAKQVGGGIAIALIVFLWLFIDVAMGVGYFIYRLSIRNR